MVPSGLSLLISAVGSCCPRAPWAAVVGGTGGRPAPLLALPAHHCPPVFLRRLPGLGPQEDAAGGLRGAAQHGAETCAATAARLRPHPRRSVVEGSRGDILCWGLLAGLAGVPASRHPRASPPSSSAGSGRAHLRCWPCDCHPHTLSVDHVQPECDRRVDTKSCGLGMSLPRALQLCLAASLGSLWEMPGVFRGGVFRSSGGGGTL